MGLIQNEHSNGKWSSSYLQEVNDDNRRADSISSGLPSPRPLYGHYPTSASLIDQW
mgnify:CR=1 FL=1